MAVGGNFFTGGSWTLPYVFGKPMAPQTSVQFPALAISEGGFPFLVFSAFDPSIPSSGEIDFESFR
jgi:hypothetical protein